MSVLGGFLALEPASRAILWWADRDLAGALHGDVLWLQLGFIALMANTVRDAVASAARNRWLVAGFAAWSVAATVSTVGAAIPAVSTALNVQWLAHLTFALVLLGRLRGDPEAARLVLLGWAAGFLGYAVVLAAFVLVVAPERIDWVWGLPGATNIRQLSFEAAAAALIGTLFRPAAARAAMLWMLRASAVAGWAFLFWSGGRGSLAATAAALLVVILFAARRGRARAVAETGVLAAAGAALSCLHVAPDASLGFWRSVQVLAAPVGSDITAGRIAIWRESIVLIGANPWFGIGEGQTKAVLASAANIFAQPHNIVLQAWLSWGLIAGTAFLTALSGRLLRAFARLRGRADVRSAAAAGGAVAVALVANAMTDAALYYPRPVMFVAIGLCVALAAPLSRR